MSFVFQREERKGIRSARRTWIRKGDNRGSLDRALNVPSLRDSMEMAPIPGTAVPGYSCSVSSGLLLRFGS